VSPRHWPALLHRSDQPWPAKSMISRISPQASKNRDGRNVLTLSVLFNPAATSQMIIPCVIHRLFHPVFPGLFADWGYSVAYLLFLAGYEQAVVQRQRGQSPLELPRQSTAAPRSMLR
jgi:hypothetical protein